MTYSSFLRYPETSLTDMDLVASNIEYVFSASTYPDFFDAYNPSWGGTGSVTFTGVTTSWANYAVCGDMLALFVRGTGTLGGSGGNGITFTLPKSIMQNAGAQTLGGGGYVYEGTDYTTGVLMTQGDGGGVNSFTSSVAVYKEPDFANYATSGALTINVRGIFKI